MSRRPQPGLGRGPLAARLRLAIFDLDGTLKQERDPYVYLHSRLGTLQACYAFLEDGLQGRISYAEWLRLDADLWKGAPLARIQQIFREDPYLPGARETVAALKQAGVKLALVSSGVTFHSDLVRDELGFDWAIANEVMVADGVISGESRVWTTEGGKGAIVEQLLAMFSAAPEQAMAVGDADSDADMFARVGLGVAVNPASQKVRDAATVVLETPDLTPLIPLLQRRGLLG